MSIVFTVILCLFLLQTKHLWLDWIWQPAYEHQNKGTFLHMGGIQHALKAAIGTGVVFMFFFPVVAVPLAALDFIIHYTVDLCKVKVTRYYGLKCDQHPPFWWLTGFDQYLHQVTYLALTLLGFWTIYS